MREKTGMEDDVDPRGWWRHARIAGGVVVIVWLGALWWRVQWPGTPAVTGTTDVFDAVTALFSGLALAGVAATLWLQAEELKAQRAELRLQRRAIQEQAEELAKHTEQMGRHHVDLERQADILVLSTMTANATVREVLSRLTGQILTRWQNEQEGIDERDSVLW